MSDTPLKELSPAWIKACAIYAKTFSTKKAAESSGFSHLYFMNRMTDPLVQQQILKNTQIIRDVILVDAGMLHNHLSELMAADSRDIYEVDGTFKRLHDWPKIWRQMLESIEFFPSGIPSKVSFMKHKNIIELTGKHKAVAAFEEKVIHQHAHVHVLDDKMVQARGRALLEHDN